MRAKSILAAVLLLVTVAIAGAIPDQPMMQAARADLQTLVNSAIAEVNAGIAYDRRHNHAVALSVEDLFATSPDQPHMERAKDALESAKNNLEHATADKGGHRAKALDLVRDAIDEVKKGIEAGKG